MTRTRVADRDDIVSLSLRDWVAFIGVLLPILAMLVFGWLRHDRLLTTLVVQQQAVSQRMDWIEDRFLEDNQ